MEESPISLDKFLGSMLVGTILSSVIYGITCLQTYIYYTRYSTRDSLFHKALVGIIWILDTVHFCLVFAAIYFYCVTHWGDAGTASRLTWTLEIEIVFGTAVTFLVQMFLARRVYHLSDKSYLLTGLIVALSLLQIGFGDAFMVHTIHLKRIALVRVDQWILTTALAGDIACDAVITVSMCILLYRKRTCVERTNKTIETLIIYTINTCLLTTICTVAMLITWTLFPTSMLFSAFYFVVVRLYANCLLSTLNTREDIREKMLGDAISLPHTSIRFSEPSERATVPEDETQWPHSHGTLGCHKHSTIV